MKLSESFSLPKLNVSTFGAKLNAMNDYTFKSEDYSIYKEQNFSHRWLRPEMLYEKLKKFSNNSDLQITEVGKSIEERSVYSVKFGRGPKKVVMWSQMHGNESTATMALMDLFNFLEADDQYEELRNLIAENLEVTMIPMLNPDGSERFTRRNALNIDLNRDAARHTMPELKILTEWVKRNSPTWALNLHDQRNIFTVGDTSKSATISFLAASADVEKTLTSTRVKSMNLISTLADVVEAEIPGHVGKYTDEFYPRALGEYFHKNEIPCVLIESGAFANDPTRDTARKMNFLCLVEALKGIATDRIPENRVEDYQNIPENTTNMLDLIIRKCSLVKSEKAFEADLGFLIKEEIDKESEVLLQKFVLQDVGDLQFHYGFKEKEGGVVDCNNHELGLEKPANLQVTFEDDSMLKFENGIIQSNLS